MPKPSRFKRNTYWRSDRIISICAMLVSVGSLVVVTRQTSLIQQQTDLIQQEQRVNGMPYLQIGGSRPKNDVQVLFLVNSGLGPALIKEVKVTKGDQVYEQDITMYFQEHFDWQTKGNHWYEFESASVGDLIPAGERLTLIGTNVNDSIFTEFARQIEEGVFNFEITYASLYGDEWKVGSLYPLPTKSVAGQ